MKRRAFISGLGSMAAAPWTLAMARAQQAARPVVGYLSFPALARIPGQLAGFRNGLAAEGFVEGRDLTIEYRDAEGKAERLPELAADLVRRRVAVLFAGGPPAALVAKRATQTIPIVFATGADPVQIGLVSSFNRPVGNITGVYFLSAELVAKRLALLHELLPRAKRVAVLVNPTNPSDFEPTVRNVAIAGRALGLDTQIFNASTGAELDAAFTALVQWRADALFVGPDPFLISQSTQVVTLATRYAIPASYSQRGSVEVGGLMSYSSDVADSYRRAGAYVGRILKGDKPDELPVVQPTRYHLVINLKTAKALGIEVPMMLLARADEVIE